MVTNWPVVGSGEDYFIQTAKRIGRLERQKSPISAADLLGPGMSAQAVQLIDWNDEIATFNGFFYSLPGAYNAPVITVRPTDEVTGLPTGSATELDPLPWTGQVIAREDGTGMQQGWNTDNPDSMYFRVRNFWVNPDDTTAPRVFGDWQRFATPSGFIDGGDLSPGVQDGIQAAYDRAVEAIAIAEGAIGIDIPIIMVFRQPTMPVSTDDRELVNGDFWFDTDDNNHMYSYNGTTWVDVQDAAITEIATQSAAALTAATDALAAAAHAIDVADAAAGSVGGAATGAFYQDAEPTGGTYVVGMTWYDTNDLNKQYRWNGTAWIPVITGWLETNATAARGIKITPTGIVAYNNSGAPTFTVVGATGDVALLGTLTAGSSIAGATITGVLQTNAAANTGIKLVGNNLYAYGGGIANTVIDGSTGRITTTGSLFTGGDINGANVTVETGGVIQTSGSASTGIKMNANGMVFYHPTTHVAMMTLNGLDGSIAMLGNLTSGSTITGGIINGGTITAATFLQSSSGSRVGLTIDNQGLTMVNFSGQTIFRSNGVDAVNGGIAMARGATINQGLSVSGGITVTGGLSLPSGALVALGTASFSSIQMGGTIDMGGNNIQALGSINGGFTTNSGGSFTVGQIAGTGGASMVLAGNGGVLQRGLPVTYGAANSAGTGFRQVRVPN